MWTDFSLTDQQWLQPCGRGPTGLTVCHRPLCELTRCDLCARLLVTHTTDWLVTLNLLSSFPPSETSLHQAPSLSYKSLVPILLIMAVISWLNLLVFMALSLPIQSSSPATTPLLTPASQKVGLWELLCTWRGGLLGFCVSAAYAYDEFTGPLWRI